MGRFSCWPWRGPVPEFSLTLIPFWLCQLAGCCLQKEQLWNHVSHHFNLDSYRFLLTIRLIFFAPLFSFSCTFLSSARVACLSWEAVRSVRLVGVGTQKLFESLTLIFFSLGGLDKDEDVSEEQRSRVLKNEGLIRPNAEPDLSSILFDTCFFGVGLGSVWPLPSGDFSRDERQVWLPAWCVAASAAWHGTKCSVSVRAFPHWPAEAYLSWIGLWQGSSGPFLSCSRAECPDGDIIFRSKWEATCPFWASFIVLVAVDASGVPLALAGLILMVPPLLPSTCLLSILDLGALYSDTRPVFIWGEFLVTTFDFILLKSVLGNFLSCSFLILPSEGGSWSDTCFDAADNRCCSMGWAAFPDPGDPEKEGRLGVLLSTSCIGVDVYILLVPSADGAGRTALPCSGVTDVGQSTSDLLGNWAPFPRSTGEGSQTKVMKRHSFSLGRSTGASVAISFSTVGSSAWVKVRPRLGLPVCSSLTFPGELSPSLNGESAANTWQPAATHIGESSSDDTTKAERSSRQKLLLLTIISSELREQHPFPVDPLQEASQKPARPSPLVESGDIVLPFLPLSVYLWKACFISNPVSWLHSGVKFAFQKCRLPSTGVAIKVWLRFVLTLQRRFPCGERLGLRFSSGESLLRGHACMLATSLWLEVQSCGESGEGEINSL